MTAMATEKLPYDAKHVFIIDEGHSVYAFWTADPVKAADAKAGRLDVGDIIMSYDFQVIASMSRFYKRDGADFSGWVVESRGHNSDGIPNKRDAMRELRAAIAEYFNR